MKLLELFVFCLKIYISLAGSPSFVSISSIINETSLQSTVPSGPWISSSEIEMSNSGDGLALESNASSGPWISSSDIVISNSIDESSIQSNVSSVAPSKTEISSSIDESSIQSNVSSGPWIYDTVDDRPPCITCYTLFKTNQNTTRKCNPNHKPIWELWYNISGILRGGFCIEFESLKNFEEINPKITSFNAVPIKNTEGVSTGSGGGGGGSASTTYYQWNKGQEIVVKTSNFPDCVPCYDFLHYYPKLSPFECNPGNNMKVKVTYEVFTGMEETGYCAGQITMSDRELRNIQKLFWTEKTDEPKCVDCYDVLVNGKNASKEFCDSGDERIWHVQYYEKNWNLALDGYCVNRMASYYHLYYWNYYWGILDRILFAQIYRLDLSGYQYYMNEDATEIEKTTCKPCAKIIADHSNTIDECQSNGHQIWQVWFNTTYGESYGGYCIDFLNIDLGLIFDNYITYILATNGTSTYEWIKSGSELKQVTEHYPSCVNCFDLADENIYLSSFYCNPGNQTKIKVDFTTVANKKIRGYCAGLFYNYTVGKTQYKPTHIEMYDIFKIHSWNERCIDCYDVFMSGLKPSNYDCDKGNDSLWQSYYVKDQYYTGYNPEFVVNGYCINMSLSYFDNWELPSDIYYVFAYSLSTGEYDDFYDQECVSCYNVIENGYSLSRKRCKSGNKQRWNISLTYHNYYYTRTNGYCIDFSSDSINSWTIREEIETIEAQSVNETFSWQRPLPSPAECVSCYDAFVNFAPLSRENCYESEQRWFIELELSYNYYYYNYKRIGYCNGLSAYDLDSWYIYYDIQHISASNGIENFEYYKPTPSTTNTYFESSSYSSSYTTNYRQCLTCYELLLYRMNYNSNCDPMGQTIWDIWFNSTDAFTDGGFCVDFLETDFNGFGDSITYIRATNDTSTVEWFKSDPEIKELNAQFPPCVSCSDVANANTIFSTFDCDPGYSSKIRAKFTNSLGEEAIGFCIGVGSYDFSPANITDVTLYDRYGTYYMPNSQLPT